MRSNFYKKVNFFAIIFTFLLDNLLDSAIFWAKLSIISFIEIINF